MFFFGGGYISHFRLEFLYGIEQKSQMVLRITQTLTKLQVVNMFETKILSDFENMSRPNRH